MKKIFLISIIICFITSCNNKTDLTFRKRTSKPNLEIINLQNLETKEAFPDSLVKIVKYIKPETTQESLISNYDKIITSGDTIYILDKSNAQQSIFAFNMKGKYLFKINAKGHGPGEYSKITDFYINQKSKYIGILNQSKILKYNFKGKYIGDIKFKGDYFITKIQIKEDLILTYNSKYDTSKKVYSIAVFDLNGNFLYEDLPERKELIALPFTKINYFSDNTTDAYVNLLNSDTIYQIRKSNVQPKFILDFGKNKLPEDELDKLLSLKGSSLIEQIFKLDYVTLGLQEFYTTDNYIYMFFGKKKETYFAFYSLKTKKTKLFTAWVNEDNILFSPMIQKFDHKRFCCTVSSEKALIYKVIDEQAGILDPKKKFDKNRINRYNFINKVKPLDNDIIVLFEINDF